MTSPRRRLRLTGALAPLLLVLSLLAACGDSESKSGAPADAAAPASGAFPVTIAHKYGSTTIKSAPKRVVTVGLTDQDALLALGVVPVATTEWFGKFPGAIGPWAQDKLGGAAKPQVLSDTGGGPQLEKIAALRPDLILGLYSELDQKTYDTLSKIAPTVAQPKEYTNYGIPWQEQTRKIGQAVGKPAEADRLVKDVEARLARARQDVPKLAGAGALVGTLYQGYFIYGSQDPRSRVLTSLGLTLPADLDKVIGDKFGASISRERLDLLDRDVIIWIVDNLAADTKKLHDDPLYKNLKVVREGREILVSYPTPYGASASWVSVLSVPYMLDRLVPQLRAALDGDPATKVEQPAS